ncbi:MAG: hypothetical protein JWO71_3530 [Candidatus Acidoferrum typicum]|nr:hypothetical protein [Candidatus Acidoferrum typicum]
MRIKRSEGLTPSERFLSELCDGTFLKLWSYPNPYKADGKELCDLLAVFEDHVFLFFDRESRKFDKPGRDTLLTWERWRKEAIEKQILTSSGAKKYISQYPNQIYLDAKKSTPFPIGVPSNNPHIHKIIVAHGAAEACKKFSSANVSGSLAVAYGDFGNRYPFPFMVDLARNDPVHILDSHNLEIIFSELDTFYDLACYLIAKETAIEQLNYLAYCGEEDLLAHYFLNFDGHNYFVGSKDKTINGVFVSEGQWQDFAKSDAYQRRKKANEVSYLWDQIMQRTCQNALDGVLLGDANIFDSRNAIQEMAKEPRFSRRALSEAMINAINGFPNNQEGIVRNLSFMPSFYKDKGYVFLQIRHPNITDYEKEYRARRSKMLQIACGAAKIKFSYLNKVIGIAIDAPKFSERNSEDFVLLNCEKWSERDTARYQEANRGLQFFETKTMKVQEKTISDFPPADSAS